MKLSGLKPQKWNNLALSFAFPVLGVVFVMLFSQYTPFGKYSMLYSDMYHQYYPFFKAFRAAILSGDSLLYSWDVGMGMDYLGLISYYLASPLNLLSILVPESILLEFFSLLVPIKLGFAGLFFGIFLKKTFGKDDISIPMFGTMYALCAWALGYQWNIMWLDTFALLPLVVLGMVALVRDKKFVLYTLTLFLAIFSNYYIGLFVCIFIFLLFFVYEICRWQGFKRFFGDLCRIALFSALAIGMTAILELPTLAALQTTQSSVNKFPEGFKLNIADENTWAGLLDAMRQVAGNMAGGQELNFKEGLPNLYCGVGSILLGFLYLLAKEVKFRDKVCAVFLLLFFNVSFIIRQLDYIWHGFHFTNMIPYRFSFLYSFVLLYMAYRAWTLRHKFKVWQIGLAAVFSLGIMACSDSRGELVFLLYNGIALVLYVAVLLFGIYKKKAATEEEKQAEKARRTQRRAITRAVFAGVMALETIANLINFGLGFTGTAISNYPKDTEYSASMIRYMKEREEDTLFYRAETTHSQTLNDGALNGYHGISTFTSSANVKVTEFMKALGYGAKNTYNRYCYEEASPVSDLFLGIKYMIERDGKDKSSSIYTDLHHYGNTHLLLNNAYLPLGFLAESELAEQDFTTGSGMFRFQNALFSSATGLDENVWTVFAGDNLIITGQDVTVKDINANGYCAYENGLENSSVIFTYVAPKDGFMVVNLNLPKRNKTYISVNGTELYSESMSLPQMLAVGDVKAGDAITVRMTCKADEKGTMTLTAGILNMDTFWEGYEILNASTLELTHFENTLVEGTIDCDRDGLLYTSIPQNGNWKAFVDGEEAEIKLVGDAMIGVELTEGEHTVTFRYHNAAFSLGVKISLLCALVFVTQFVLVYKPKINIRPGKFQK